MAEGEEEDKAQKTEEPTPKKLEEARKKGNVPLSREVNNWLMLLAATLLVGAYSNTFMSNLSDHLQIYIEHSYGFQGGEQGAGVIMKNAVYEVLVIMAFPFLVLMIVAFLAPFGQVGVLFSAEKIKPDISKISPIKGMQRLFSMNSIMEFAKGVLKLAIITIVSVVIIYPYFDKFEHLINLPVAGILEALKNIILRMLIGVLVVLIIVAIIDLVFQRYQHYQKMRMTKQEVKDEHKQTEGDPHVKARLRQLRTEKARQRMMQAVPEADVVITNPTHYSVALKYEPKKMEAPLCLAKGIDDLALRIREVAKEHDIVLYENKPLARALYDTVDIDETIPAEHFKAVAEIISYVFKLKGKLKF